ncbi:hypothetical protein pb186bvf_013806 [Paramecium bursaria]
MDELVKTKQIFFEETNYSLILQNDQYFLQYKNNKLCCLCFQNIKSEKYYLRNHKKMNERIIKNILFIYNNLFIIQSLKNIQNMKTLNNRNFQQQRSRVQSTLNLKDDCQANQKPRIIRITKWNKSVNNRSKAIEEQRHISQERSEIQLRKLKIKYLPSWKKFKKSKSNQYC